MAARHQGSEKHSIVKESVRQKKEKRRGSDGEKDDELHRRMEEGTNRCVPAGGGDKEEVCTIVRLPSHVHLTNKGLYEPRLVSIGPYHLDSASTRGMQGRKWRFLRDFLVRENRNGGTNRLAACIEEVRAMEARARRCYAEPPEIGSDEFVQLLVLDGSFILEFLLKYWGRRGAGGAERELDAYMQSLWVYVYYDLLLVENQIPFFVIEKLFNIANLAMPMVDPKFFAGNAAEAVVDQRLLALITGFFSLKKHLPQVQPIQPTTVHHLLHLKYQMMIPEQLELGRSKLMTAGTTTTTPLTIPCAIELFEKFGVTFKEKASPASQFDVTFRGGTMEIPRLAIDDGTGILLANLLALEHTKDWNGGILTGYVVLMNALLNTGADVTVLQRRGVLDNMLPSEEDAAAFFNRLGGCALFDPTAHHYTELFKEINKYCDSRWNLYMALLKRNYLRSPCAIISLLVAAILLCMSALSGSYVIYRLLHNSP